MEWGNTLPRWDATSMVDILVECTLFLFMHSHLFCSPHVVFFYLVHV